MATVTRSTGPTATGSTTHPPRNRVPPTAYTRSSGSRWKRACPEARFRVAGWSSRTPEALAAIASGAGGARGAEVVTAVPSAAVGRLDGNTYGFNPEDPDSFRGLVTEVSRTGPAPFRGAIYLWALGASADEDLTCADLEAAQSFVCGGALAPGPRAGRRWPARLPSALARHARRAAGRRGGGSPASLLQAPLWGLGRSLALEHPETWGGLVDLDPCVPAGEAEALVEAIARPGEGTQVAFRAGRWHVPRLARAERLAGTADGLALRPEGTYLITGGLGSLGLLAARWLAQRGARRLVLLGRRGLPDRALWDGLPPSDASFATVAAVRELEGLGATVIVAAADVADPSQMAALFGQLRKNLPPIRGVIHAAGVIEPRASRDLDLRSLQAVLRPKVQGTWALHQLTRDLPLDFLVLFSSVSSVWGSARLVDYAAANQFLDAFAHFRRALWLAGAEHQLGPVG